MGKVIDFESRRVLHQDPAWDFKSAEFVDFSDSMIPKTLWESLVHRFNTTHREYLMIIAFLGGILDRETTSWMSGKSITFITSLSVGIIFSPCSMLIE